MWEFCMVDAKMGTKYVLLTYSAHTSSKYVTIVRLCIYTYIHIMAELGLPQILFDM